MIGGSAAPIAYADLPAALRKRIDEAFFDQVVDLVANATINRTYDVPYSAGRSTDGKTVYIDKNIPETLECGLDPEQTLPWHELSEWLAQNEGEEYQDAHKLVATPFEKTVVDALGGDWSEYSDEFDGLDRAVDDETITSVPPDLDLRPFEDEDDRKMLQELKDDAAKSTFAAPAGPTTGIQGYSLEGQKPKSRRKRPRRFIKPAPADAHKEIDAMSLNLFIPITKIDAAKRLVYGVATAEVPDRSNEVCDYATTKPLYEKWSGDISKATDGKSFGNLRVMHGNVAAGKLTSIGFNDVEKKIEICAKVVDDGEWKKVEEGVYTGFSQGGKYVKRWKDEAKPELMRYTAEPVEISLVDLPCLPEASFSIIKADGTTELRKFKTVADVVEPAAPEVAARAMELAKAAGSAVWHDFIDAARDELVKAADKETATKAVAEADPVHGTTRSDDGTEEQVWVHKRLAGQSFKTKSDLRKALAALDADEAAKVVVDPVKDALADLTKELDKRDGGDAKAKAGEGEKAKTATGLEKKSFTDDERKKLAASGAAMPDGGFPIENKQDLKNAVQAYGQAKNKTSAKRHIIQRAKALGATDLLPADWATTKKAAKAAESDELKKTASLWSLSNLIQLLASVEQAEEDFEFPGYGLNMYGSASATTVPKDLCDRFGAATVELGDIISEALDLIVNAMRDEEDSEASMALAAVADDLLKVGARHSATDQSRLNKAHDLLVGAGAACGGMDAGDEATKGTQAELAKVVAEKDALAKAIGEMPGAIKEILARVKNIEEQPVVIPPRSSLTVVGKDGRAVPLDGVPGDGGSIDKFVETLTADDLPRVAQALIRKSQQNPQPTFGQR